MYKLTYVESNLDKRTEIGQFKTIKECMQRASDFCLSDLSMSAIVPPEHNQVKEGNVIKATFGAVSRWFEVENVVVKKKSEKGVVK